MNQSYRSRFAPVGTPAREQDNYRNPNPLEYRGVSAYLATGQRLPDSAIHEMLVRAGVRPSAAQIEQAAQEAAQLEAQEESGTYRSRFAPGGAQAPFVPHSEFTPPPPPGEEPDEPQEAAGEPVESTSRLEQAQEDYPMREGPPDLSPDGIMSALQGHPWMEAQNEERLRGMLGAEPAPESPLEEAEPEATTPTPASDAASEAHPFASGRIASPEQLADQLGYSADEAWVAQLEGDTPGFLERMSGWLQPFALLADSTLAALMDNAVRNRTPIVSIGGVEYAANMAPYFLMGLPDHETVYLPSRVVGSEEEGWVRELVPPEEWSIDLDPSESAAYPSPDYPATRAEAIDYVDRWVRANEFSNLSEIFPVREGAEWIAERVRTAVTGEDFEGGDFPWGEWPAYAPGGAYPERPVTGLDVARDVFQIQDPTGQAILGVGLELFADPLMAAPFLRGVGHALTGVARPGTSSFAARVAEEAAEAAGMNVPRNVNPNLHRTPEGYVQPGPTRAAADAATSVDTPGRGLPVERQGFASVGEDLIRAGNALDEAMSIAGLARGVWSAAGPVRDVIEGLVGRGVQYIQQASGNSPRLANWLLTQREATRLRLDPRGQAATVGIPEGSSARTFGEFVNLEAGMASAATERFADRALGAIDNIQRQLGFEQTGVMRRVFGSLRGLPAVYRQVDGLPTVLTETISSRAAQLLDAGGPLVTGIKPAEQVLAQDVRRLQDVLGTTLPMRQSTQAWQSAYDEALDAVFETARASGFDRPEQLASLEGRFQSILSEFQTINLSMAFEATGYPYARELFLNNYAARTGATHAEALRAWTDIQAAQILTGEDIHRIVINPMPGRARDRVFIQGGGAAPDSAAAARAADEFGEGVGAVELSTVRPAVENLLDDVKPFTLDDLLGEAPVAAMSLNPLVDSFQHGHLRRALGAFSTPDGMHGSVRAFEQGRLMSNHIISNDVGAGSALFRALGDRPDILEDFEALLRATERPASSSTRPGFNEPLFEYLVEQGRNGGLSPREAVAEANRRLGAGQSAVIRQDVAIRHLAEGLKSRGVSDVAAYRQARDAWVDVFREVQPELSNALLWRSPSYIDELTMANVIRAREGLPPLRGPETGPLEVVRTRADELAAMRNDPQGINPSGAGAFAQRQDLSEDFLLVTNEIMDAMGSLAESTRAMEQWMPLQQFMRNIYQTSLRNGAVVSDAEAARRMNLPGVAESPSKAYINADGVQYIRIPDDQRHLWGAYAGKWIHPQLHAEITKVFKNPYVVPSTLNHIRSLVQGGMLATPRSIVRNFAGAMYTASIGNGVNPAALARYVAQEFKGLASGTSEWRALLSEYIPLGRLSRSRQIMLQRDADRVNRIAAGLTETGAGPTFSHLGDAVQRFLERPAGGRMLGLDAFQFVDELVRVSSFRMRAEELISAGVSAERALAQAAELARVSALDYSQIPLSVALLRDYGVFTFPSFSVLNTGRNVAAAITRPGGLALWDRAPRALTEAVLGPETYAEFMSNTEDWTQSETPVPIMRWADENGVQRYIAYNMQQWFPTGLHLFGDLSSSVASSGFGGAVQDAINAYMNGDGVALHGQRFGQQVFRPESEGWERVQQTLSFLYNSFAPSIAQAAWSPTVGPERDRGVIPEAIRGIQGMILPDDVVDAYDDWYEVEYPRPQLGLGGAALTAVLGSPRVVEVGPDSAARRQFDRDKSELQARISGWDESIRHERAKGSQGDPVIIQNLQAKQREAVSEFWIQWAQRGEAMGYDWLTPLLPEQYRRERPEPAPSPGRWRVPWAQ